MQTDSTRTNTRGFSLVELLVVILIIAIVIAIIVPALGHARIAARKVATASMLTEVTKGAERFSQDSAGQMPGYFSPKEMGGRRNMPGSSGGFTTMENALLDLVARDAILGDDGPSGGGNTNTVQGVGPMGMAGGKTQPRNLVVDLDRIGTGATYLDLDADSLRVASGQNARTGLAEKFPDVVDAFGNPVLAWVEDPMAPRIPESEIRFAAEDSGGESARYYWNSNAAWLTSTAMGRGGMDQTLDPTGSPKKFGSLLNRPSEAFESLTAVLGNPNFPTPTDYTQRPDEVLPSASRGSFVVHSAGADGIFFSPRDPGARAIGVTGEPGSRPLQYALNFFVEGKDNGGLWKDDKGLPTTIDLVQGFDDLITSTGN